MVHQEKFSLRTAGQGDMHDITPQVAAAVVASSIKTGTVNVFNVGSTAAIGTIEFEPGYSKTCRPSSTSSSPLVATTATSRRGTTATAIRICRQPCSAPH